MRAKEFISEDRQKLDEVLPLIPVALKGLALAGAGYQAYESWNDYQDYKSGKIDGAELSARIGVDAATALIGGVVGKGVVKGGKSMYDAFKSAAKYKLAQQAAKKSDDVVAAATPKPGSTIQTPKGPRVAGVDGKPTTIDPTKRGARADIKKIKQAAKEQPAAGKAGAGVAAAAKKADDVIPPKVKGGKAGAAASTMASGGKKALDKIMGKKGGRIGAGLALGAGDVTGYDDDVKDWFKSGSKSGSASSTAGKNIAGLGGDLVYTGTETNPEVVRLKGVNDPMPYMTKPSPYKTDPLTGKPKQPTTNDSNSPVPTAKDPKLPKQNTTSLATQQGVK